MDSDDIFVFASAVSVLSLAYLAWKRQARSARRWYWIHPDNKNSVLKEGEYFTLFTRMKENSHDRFREYTRMEVWQWDYLLQLLKSHLSKSSFRQPISPEERLAIAIRFLAHGGSKKTVAKSFRSGHSTVQKVTEETCNTIWTVLREKYVSIPYSEGWKKIVDEFWSLRNFPNCFGAVDGKHIDIQAPKKSGSEYFNYKSRNSIVLMAMRDARYKFTWVDIGAYGARNDSSIFSESSFGTALINGDLSLPPNSLLPNTNKEMPSWCVADQAFPLPLHIMRPYAGHNLPDSKRIFNYRLSRARRVIENTFGILTTRWRASRSRLHAEPFMVENYVKAAICLHNFVMESSPTNRNLYCPASYVDSEANSAILPGEWRQHIEATPLLQDLGRIGANNSARAAITTRNVLCDYLNSQKGEVVWQYDTVNQGWQ